MIPLNPVTGSVDAKTIEAQTEQVSNNLIAVLTEAGTSTDKAIKTTCFLSDMSDFAAFNEMIYANILQTNPHAPS